MPVIGSAFAGHFRTTRLVADVRATCIKATESSSAPTISRIRRISFFTNAEFFRGGCMGSTNTTSGDSAGNNILASPCNKVIREITSAATPPSALARAMPSASNRCISTERSINVTSAPKDASRNASRPSPAVASTIFGAFPPFIPTALGNACPRPPPKRWRWATVPPIKSQIKGSLTLR